MSHLIDAQLGFENHFPSSPACEEFAEEWKNSNRFYLTYTPAETSVAPIAGYEEDENEVVEEEEDTSNPDDASANSCFHFYAFVVLLPSHFEMKLLSFVYLLNIW